MNNKVCWLAMSVLVGASLASAQTLYTQDFESTWPPTGWAVHSDVQAETCVWHRARDLGDTMWSENTTHFAVFLNRPDTDISETLISPVIDCSGHGSIVLRCSTYVIAGFLAYEAQILGSIDGGQTYPYQVRSYEPPGSVHHALETLDLGWAGDQAQVRLAWEYGGRSSALGGWWAIDNVSITGDPLRHDMATDSIMAPRGFVDSGATITPTAAIHNYGNVTESLVARFKIGSGYNRTQSIRDLPAGGEITVAFPAWSVSQVGRYAVSCSTELSGDADPSNNAVHDSTRAVVRDVGVTRIIAPRDTVDSGRTMHPSAVVTGDNTYPTYFPVVLTVTPTAYRDTEWVTLAPRQVDTIVFAKPWTPVHRARHIARCTTAMAHDIDPRNNLKAETLFVRVGIEEPSPLSSAPPKVLSLGPASPNPFAERIVVGYGIPLKGRFDLGIYNSCGALIRELESGAGAPGFHQTAWDGRNSDGRRSERGIYFCRLEAGGRYLTEKLIKLQ